MRFARASQKSVSGGAISLSITSNATAMAARTVRNCWRSLICTDTSSILNVQRELERRRASPNLRKLHRGDPARPLQPLFSGQEILHAASHAVAHHRVQIANLERLGSHRPILRERSRDLFHDLQ